MYANKVLLLIFAAAALASCSKMSGPPAPSLPTTMKEIPASRLNFRYEGDVPAPPESKTVATAQARNAAIQADFDQNRAQELLDSTTASPDGKRCLAVYHRAGDMPAEFRLDMYSGDGKILRRVTPDSLAVHFPDTIVWSPNSENIAFVGMLRATAPADPNAPPPAGPAANANAAIPPVSANANNANAGAGETAEAQPTSQPQLPGPAAVLAFRTEQIYLVNTDGDGLKPLTQNEGLIYFYYVWAPDSSALAASAATARDWQFFQARSDSKGEVFIPLGRPRIVERNGRERRLDDTNTSVQPVWAPDSSKVAVGFDMQIRIYDAIGNAPTQAAIPLRNYLRISSAAYDRDLEKKLTEGHGAVDTTAAQPADNANTNTNAEAPVTLPDESSLVSFNPIVALNWQADNLLYFQTAYIKHMKNEGDSVTSYQRWHRLVFTPQPVAGS